MIELCSFWFHVLNSFDVWYFFVSIFFSLSIQRLCSAKHLNRFFLPIDWTTKLPLENCCKLIPGLYSQMMMIHRINKTILHDTNSNGNVKIVWNFAFYSSSYFFHFWSHPQHEIVVFDFLYFILCEFSMSLVLIPFRIDPTFGFSISLSLGRYKFGLCSF